MQFEGPPLSAAKLNKKYNPDIMIVFENVLCAYDVYCEDSDWIEDLPAQSRVVVFKDKHFIVSKNGYIEDYDIFRKVYYNFFEMIEERVNILMENFVVCEYNSY